ncbi:hypothetical protein RFI_38378, partial [Reticulomyxa filosa]
TLEESISHNESVSDTILNELNIRTGDLNELFYKQVTERSENESESDTEKASDTRHELSDEIKSHNNDFLFSLQKLASPNFFSDQRKLQQVARSNQQWQDEIFKMVYIVAFVKKEMLTEMKDRTEDLQTAISVSKNEKPATELGRIVSKNKQHHDAIQQELDKSTTLPSMKKRQLSPMIHKSSWHMKIWLVKSLSNICKMLLSRTYNHTYDIYYICCKYIICMLYVYTTDNIKKNNYYFLIIKGTNLSGVVCN